MKKKNNTAEKAILNAENISKALKEGTEKSLQGIISEAVKSFVNESEDDDEDLKDNEQEDEDNTFEVEDVDDNEGASEDETPEEEGDEASEEEPADDEAETEDGADDEWSDEEPYKIDDDTYDMSDADMDDVLKVYNKMNDDDEILVKDDGDGDYSFEDGDNEYEIELDPDAEMDSEVDDFDDDEDAEDGEDEFELELGPEDDAEEGSEDFDFDSEDGEDEVPAEDDDEIEIVDDDEDADAEPAEDDDYDIEITDDDEDGEDDELNEESLFDWNYQDKTAMTTPSNNEPANPKATYTMDDVPEGTEKRFEKGVGKGEPFDKKVNECGCANCDGDDCNIEEAAMSTSTQSMRKETKSYTSQPRKEHAPQVTKNISTAADGYTEELKESVKKIVKKAREIQLENKQYRTYIEKIKQSLTEAAVLNVTLGQVVKLLSENSTTKDEKRSIVERFNNVKTIKESKQLYETISRELNENKKPSVVLEQRVSEANKAALNEMKIYSKRENNPTLDLMLRVESLGKRK